MIPLNDDNITSRTPIVNWSIILSCIAVFVWQTQTGVVDSVHQFGFVPNELREGNWGQGWHALASIFMHGGLMHIVSNLWFLHIFGDNVEDETGHFNYALFFLLCGVAAAGVHYLSNPQSPVPMVGASGALSGVLGAYMVLHPRARIRVWLGLFFFPSVPAYFFLFIWAGLQFLNGISMHAMHTAHGVNQGGVAYWAHIGGFLAGIFFILAMSKGKSEPEPRYYR